MRRRRPNYVYMFVILLVWFGFSTDTDAVCFVVCAWVRLRETGRFGVFTSRVLCCYVM